MTKSYRQGQILKLIRGKRIGTQDELAQELKNLGIAATQESSHFTRPRVTQHQHRIAVGVPNNLRTATGEILHVHCGREFIR